MYTYVYIYRERERAFEQYGIGTLLSCASHWLLRWVRPKKNRKCIRVPVGFIGYTGC